MAKGSSVFAATKQIEEFAGEYRRSVARPRRGRVPGTGDAEEAAPMGGGSDTGITRTSGVNTWRAGCGESRLSGCMSLARLCGSPAVGQGFPLWCKGLADQEFHIIVAVHRDFLGRVLRSERSQRWAGRCGSRRCRGRWRGTRRPKPHTFTSMPTPRSRNEQSHAPLRSEPSPADIDHPTSFSPSSRASDYVELLIRQTPTPQGKSLTDRPVFHIIVQGTYNRTCDFHRIRLKQACEDPLAQ